MPEKEPNVKVVTVRETQRKIPLVSKRCMQCEIEFLGTKRQKYCSKRCSNLAAYWRNPEVYRQSRMKSYRKRKEQPVKRKT